MAAPLTDHIPDDAPLKWPKKGTMDQIGGSPPICSVPIQTMNLKGKLMKVKIKITETLDNNIMKFSGWSGEQAFCHVQFFRIRSRSSSIK